MYYVQQPADTWWKDALQSPQVRPVSSAQGIYTRRYDAQKAFRAPIWLFGSTFTCMDLPILTFPGVSHHTAFKH